MAAALSIPLEQSSRAVNSTEATLAKRVDLICASPLFTGLTQQACEKIASLARPKALARDELLFMQGGTSRKVALIRSGSVKITQLAPNGNEVILWMYGVGNVVGLLSESASRIINFSARALEASTALVWDYAAIQELMVEYPQLRMNASNILATRLNELEERFREVATERVAKRMALTLMRLRREIGKEVRGGVQVSLLREELAQMTGTTLFTASRILSQWGRMGFISPRREGVLVRDVHRLQLAGESEM